MLDVPAVTRSRTVVRGSIGNVSARCACSFLSLVAVPARSVACDEPVENRVQKHQETELHIFRSTGPVLHGERMTWMKLDDQFFRHPKARAAGLDGRALFVASLCYCTGQLTNGAIGADVVALLVAEAGVKASAVKKLVSLNLWEQTADGYIVHNYLRYQPSADEVRAARAKKAAAGKLGGKQKAANRVAEPLADARESASEPLAEPWLSPSPLPPDVVKSSCYSEPAATDPDEERFGAATPTARTVAAVFDRCAESRMRGITVNQPGPYKRSVVADLERSHGAKLRTVIEAHPDAPVQTLAGWVLGEPNSLAQYQQKATA